MQNLSSSSLRGPYLISTTIQEGGEQLHCDSGKLFICSPSDYIDLCGSFSLEESLIESSATAGSSSWILPLCTKGWEVLWRMRQRRYWAPQIKSLALFIKGPNIVIVNPFTIKAAVQALLLCSLLLPLVNWLSPLQFHKEIPVYPTWSPVTSNWFPWNQHGSFLHLKVIKDLLVFLYSLLQVEN